MPELGSLIEVIWYSSFLIASRLIGAGFYFFVGSGTDVTTFLTLGDAPLKDLTFLIEKILRGISF